MEWLGTLRTATLPRVAISSQTLPHAAVRAIERAAEVRCGAAPAAARKTLRGVPADAVVCATADRSLSAAAPARSFGLGDRAMCLNADGLPFGLRGYVVGRHGENVEFLADQPFLGGGALQGTCSNFRGKLVAGQDLLPL